VSPESRRSMPNRAWFRLRASFRFSFGVSSRIGEKIARASRHKARRSDRAWILDLSSIYLSLDSLDVGATSALCARTTSSATEVTPIFSITRPL